ncbi:MAG: hypothetical protein OXU22_09610, partial [Gammaproteobacteria bacterium]|nr:hypothetical protein [Gammaproteobacteria bacterium]
MTLPLAQVINTDALDSGGDSPSDARAALAACAEALKQLLDAIDAADGLAPLDANRLIPSRLLFETDDTLEFSVAGGVRTLRHVQDRVGAAIVSSGSANR